LSIAGTIRREASPVLTLPPPIAATVMPITPRVV
jgi:hypothetical protein